MKKTVQNLNYLLFACGIGCLLYYDGVRGLWLKGVTSLWFVALGAVNVVYALKQGFRNRRFLVFLELALVFAAAADVCLGIEFLLGTVVFALGHVFCFCAFVALEKLRKADFVPMALIALAALAVVFCSPWITLEDGFMRILLFAYAIIISAMLGKAVSNFRVTPTKARRLFALSSAMFWFSDLMLALHLFGSGGELAGDLCMYTYWPGQLLLAHSLYWLVEET